MGVLIAILLVVIIILLGVIGYILTSIEKWLAILTEDEVEEQPEAKVSDPFTKPKPIYSSTSHIVVPKTPTEIRNQNYKKIKEGIEYGDIDRG